MIKLCKVHLVIWPQEVGRGPKPSHLINHTASQVMNPTDLPHCHPGDSEKLLDHLESTQILGLACPHLDLGLKLQPKSRECLPKLFTSIWDVEWVIPQIPEGHPSPSVLLLCLFLFCLSLSLSLFLSWWWWTTRFMPFVVLSMLAL